MTATIRWKGWASLALGAWLCGWWLLSPYPVDEAMAMMVGALVAALALWHMYDEISWEPSHSSRADGRT